MTKFEIWSKGDVGIAGGYARVEMKVDAADLWETKEMLTEAFANMWGENIYDVQVMTEDEIKAELDAENAED